jgi:hypothetical protein
MPWRWAACSIEAQLVQFELHCEAGIVRSLQKHGSLTVFRTQPEVLRQRESQDIKGRWNNYKAVLCWVDYI